MERGNKIILVLILFILVMLGILVFLVFDIFGLSKKIYFGGNPVLDNCSVIYSNQLINGGYFSDEKCDNLFSQDNILDECSKIKHSDECYLVISKNNFNNCAFIQNEMLINYCSSFRVMGDESIQ